MVTINKHPLFTEEVYSFKMPNHDFWKKEINTIINIESNSVHNLSSKPPQKETNIRATRTAWDSHLRYPSLKNLSQEINNILKMFVETEGFDIPNINVFDCWINWYGKNEFAVPHHHGLNIAFVYFVDVEDTDASFLFHNRTSMSFKKKQENGEYRNDIKKIKPKNGTCLFFSGSLLHSVSPNLSNKIRKTLAMNFEISREVDISSVIKSSGDKDV